MNILIYIIRFFLAFLFVYAGIEKLFLPYDPSLFRANASESNPMFFQFYDFLQKSGYLYFVGFFQLLCGLMLIFKRTYLLASIMLIPLILCLLMVHVFFSQNTFYRLFDGTMFLLNMILLLPHSTQLKGIILKKQDRWI